MTVTTLPSAERRDDSWRLEAICAQVDPELWFPEHGSSEEAREAKRICAECPVKAECQEYALENRIDHGVWGGCSERERRRILRRRRQDAAAAV